jgi:hypothetical protein
LNNFIWRVFLVGVRAFLAVLDDLINLLTIPGNIHTLSKYLYNPGYYPENFSWIRISPESAGGSTRITQAQVWMRMKVRMSFNTRLSAWCGRTTVSLTVWRCYCSFWSPNLGPDGRKFPADYHAPSDSTSTSLYHYVIPTAHWLFRW